MTEKVPGTDLSRLHHHKALAICNYGTRSVSTVLIDDSTPMFSHGSSGEVSWDDPVHVRVPVLAPLVGDLVPGNAGTSLPPSEKNTTEKNTGNIYTPSPPPTTNTPSMDKRPP